MLRAPRRAATLCAAILLAVGLAAAADADGPQWLAVEYGDLVDLRRTTQSGEQVAELLDAARGEDPAARRRALELLAPVLEPYAFVVPDALDALAPSGDARAPLVEIAGLWAEGDARPAWVALARARRIVIESDGAGTLRVVLPAGDGTGDPERIVRAAWDRWWGVVRHALASVRRGLGDGSAALHVRVHAYRHDLAASRFEVTRVPLELTVEDTSPRGDRPPLDVAAIERFLSGGLLLEGARLRPDGRLELLGTPVEEPPALLGAPLSLADFAVAWRAVAHGGTGRPFMSLDRGADAHRLEVHHGGRLADTRLGLVTMLCDVRFKTFSQGIDPWTGRDDRSRLVSAVPGFATHVERFAGAAEAAGIQTQQTRFWFYPDAIDLTLSPEGDVLVFRRARMSAASERAAGSEAPVPPWTRATVTAINEAYDRLAAVYPELAGLDQVVRLLALFTWLERLDDAGAPVPDLDALLAVELPAVATPRSFPQQLAFNALPAPGSGGRVDVFDRHDVTAALDRLGSPTGRPLAPRVRARRALQALDVRKPSHARVAAALERALAADPPPATARLDALSQEAERLAMHRLVLGTLADDAKRALAARARAGEKLRVFSTATGGLDLSMDGALDRARPARRLSLTWDGPSSATRPSRGTPRAVGRPAPAPAGPAPGAAPVVRAPRAEWRREPPGLRHAPLPGHAFGPLPAAGDPPAIRRGGALLLASGRVRAENDRAASWWLAVSGPFAPRPSARLVVRAAEGGVRAFVRVVAGRRLAYVVRARGAAVVLARDDAALPAAVDDAIARVLAPAAADVVAAPPEGLRLLELPAARGDEPRVELVTSAAGDATRTIPIDRVQLVRLALGPGVDLPPAGRPIPPLVPPSSGFERAGTVMLRDAAPLRRPPWAEGWVDWPGELFAPHVARGLAAWWRRGARVPAVVVGTSAGSPVRWREAPPIDGRALLLLPGDATGWPHEALRDAVRAAWHAGPVAEDLAAVDQVPAVVVLVTAEPPARLARRLARLAASPRLAGRLLAVYDAGMTPPRADLPAALLARGRLAGLGLSEPGPTAAAQAVEALATWQRALQAAAGESRRVEALGGPFLWYF